jgi:hypothetical protein
MTSSGPGKNTTQIYFALIACPSNLLVSYMDDVSSSHKSLGKILSVCMSLRCLALFLCLRFIVKFSSSAALSLNPGTHHSGGQSPVLVKL